MCHIPKGLFRWHTVISPKFFEGSLRIKKSFFEKGKEHVSYLTPDFETLGTKI